MALRLLLAALWLGGCALSGRADGESFDGGVEVGDPGARGTPACQLWQRSFCDYAADRCGLIERSRCDGQNRGVICRDDTLATACAESFQVASCGRPPIGCEIIDVADGNAAAELCERYFEAQCESNVRCGIFDDVDECLASPLFTFDCRRALSVAPSLEQCLVELANRRCDQPVPICDEVVRAR